MNCMACQPGHHHWNAASTIAIILLAFAAQLLAANPVVSDATLYVSKPVPLLLPTPGKSHKLTIQKEGLELLSSLQGPVAPIVVIGPYRSGKSFTLNQLLGVPCDQGFGVGHTRATQTKGMWVWGEPQPRTLPDGTNYHVLYVDTEGFESAGKSNSYDDRIFAISALLSSLLVYNLPETIRESDISRLSFAVELAQGFYSRSGAAAADPAASSVGASSLLAAAVQGGSAAGGTAGAAGGGFQPGSMLWLIQRDFLQGVPVSEVVKEALAPVPNTQDDPELDSLNSIRASLAAIAANSTGYALKQPHLQRTRLCELSDDQLDQQYVKQREGLKALVQELAHPKVVSGRQYSGTALAALLQRMVTALNQQEIPNVGAIIDVFNRDLLSRCVAQYTASMSQLVLPMSESDLEKSDLAAKAAAVTTFSSGLLGSRRGQQLEGELLQALAREYHHLTTENQAASATVCGEAEATCESQLDGLQSMRLPSMHKFEAALSRCKRAFERTCVGPMRSTFEERLTKAGQRARAAFSGDYNNRLYTGLLVVSLLAVVVFRFLWRLRLLEGLGWCAFIFLEVYPHLHAGSGSMYDMQWWKLTARGWEWVMLLLFGFDGAWVVWLLLAAAAFTLRLLSRRQQRRSKRQKVPPARAASGGGSVKDLDV